MQKDIFSPRSVATIILLTIFSFVFSENSNAQNKGILEIGPEVQVYPAGFMTLGRVDWKLSEQFTFNARVGYNFARRQDFGEHDNEEGGGPGIVLGARRYFKSKYQGLFVGGRVDLWRMEIDWRDEVLSGPARIGSTDITVLQPVAEVGYTFELADGKWTLSPTAAAGVEVNISTDGEDVGEGGIWLGSLNLSYRF